MGILRLYSLLNSSLCHIYIAERYAYRMSAKNRHPDSYRLLFGTENSMIWLVAIVGLGLSLAALLLILVQKKENL